MAIKIILFDEKEKNIDSVLADNLEEAQAILKGIIKGKQNKWIAGGRIYTTNSKGDILYLLETKWRSKKKIEEENRSSELEKQVKDAVRYL